MRLLSESGSRLPKLAERQDGPLDPMIPHHNGIKIIEVVSVDLKITVDAHAH